MRTTQSFAPARVRYCYVPSKIVAPYLVVLCRTTAGTVGSAHIVDRVHDRVALLSRSDLGVLNGFFDIQPSTAGLLVSENGAPSVRTQLRQKHI